MARRTRLLITETFEEKQARKRREAARRLRILISVAVVTIMARIFIKDPVKPPPPVHNVPIKIMPGMLASLPPSERAKLDPQIIAKLMLADEQAKTKKLEMLAMAQTSQRNAGPYVPPARLETSGEPDENAKQQLYAYSKRQKIADTQKEEFRKKEEEKFAALVRFSNGGNLKVNEATTQNGLVRVRLPGVAAVFPRQMVATVTQNAAGWEEPVPADKIKFKPARGITVILDRETARRVTVRKQVFDEI